MEVPDILRSPIAKAASDVTMVPQDDIMHMVVIVFTDKGAAVVHSLCCDAHLADALAAIAIQKPYFSRPIHPGEDN